MNWGSWYMLCADIGNDARGIDPGTGLSHIHSDRDLLDHRIGLGRIIVLGTRVVGPQVSPFRISVVRPLSVYRFRQDQCLIHQAVIGLTE